MATFLTVAGGIAIGIGLVALLLMEVGASRRRRIMRERMIPPAKWTRPFNRW